MTGKIDARLAELGITLPQAPAPAAAYVPYIVSGDLVFVSGQISMDADGLRTGKVGDGVSVEQAQESARCCALALLAQLKNAAGGDLDRVAQVVKLTGFVNAAPDFTDHPEVINGASHLMAEVFGDKGQHARAAVGSSSLPRGVQVEVEGIFRLA